MVIPTSSDLLNLLDLLRHSPQSKPNLHTLAQPTTGHRHPPSTSGDHSPTSGEPRSVGFFFENHWVFSCLLYLHDLELALDSGCKKVVVIDIDVHYGNRTAEGFYRSDKVLIVSLHMNHSSWGPSHPQSGSFDELGDGDGFGYNLNVPLPNGTRDQGYEFALIELVVTAVEKFQPDMIVMEYGLRCFWTLDLEHFCISVVMPISVFLDFWIVFL
ncbi:hypothetical protein C3L33_13957, partial [Rhododendron williamsianum]